MKLGTTNNLDGALRLLNMEKCSLLKRAWQVQELQPEPKKGKPEPPAPTSVKCIVLDGEVIDASQWKTLKKIPTKEELLTKIALGIKANPRKIATGLKAIPSKLAYGVKALSELNDDKSMTVEAAAAAKSESD